MEKNKLSKLNIIARKILTVLPKIFYDILIVFCVLLTVVIVLQRITNSNQSFYGIRIFSVISGSMVPKYDIGEVVICKDVNPAEIEIGDVIVYRGNVGELTNRLVMHEVVSIDIDEIGYRIFHVKGLQNTAGDPDVMESQVLGEVVFKSVILTFLYALATSVYSSFIIIVILVINVFVSFKPSKKPKQLGAHIEPVEDENRADKNDNEENDDDEIKEENNEKDNVEENKEIEKEEIKKEDKENKQEDIKPEESTTKKSRTKNVTKKKKSAESKEN